MPAAALPINENARLQAVEHYRVLDTKAERVFDELTKLTAQICGTPVALLSVLDESRNWFKSRYGVDVESSQREYAFCAHAILGNEVFEVNDASRDPRFADSPLVRFSPSIRFYAGMPLTTPDGHNLGTLCALDVVPRQLTDHQRLALQTLAKQAMTLLEMRLQAQLMQERLSELEAKDKEKSRAESHLKTLLEATMETNVLVDRNGKVENFNAVARAYVSAYYGRDLKVGDTMESYVPDANLQAYRLNIAKALAGEIIETERQVVVANEPPAWYHIRYMPVRHDGQEVIGFAISITDITGRKLAEGENEDKANRLSEITKIQSHDLRGPLTSIIGLARLMKAEEMSEPNRELLSYLKTSAARLDEVIHKIVRTSVTSTAETGRMISP